MAVVGVVIDGPVVVVAAAGVKVQETKLRLKQLPNKVYASSLEGYNER